MTESIVLTSEGEIVAALADDRLIPPPGPNGGGSTLATRAAMARFSAPDEHPARRAAVETAIASIDPATAARLAGERAARRLRDAGHVEMITSIARPVAVEAIGLGFGVPEGAFDEVVRDVDAIAEVIGRGGAPTVAADDATDRLSARFESHACGAVAVISALYQSMDATAALVATRLLAGAPGLGAVVPIARTKRVAVEETEVDGVRVPARAAVDIELGPAGMWFGSGAHACPGRALAESIAVAVVAAIVASDLTVDVERAEIDPDGRPTAVWLQPGER